MDAAPAPQLLAYLDAMLAANEHVNLTAIRDRAQALGLHVADSLALGRAGLAPGACLDLGSGNGFPGVALHFLHPAAEVVLMERTRKKALAIERCLGQAGITGVRVVCVDAAQAPALHPELRAHFDLVTARAVGEPEQVARLARPLLARDGVLALWLEAGAAVAPELAQSLICVQQFGYELPAPAARSRKIALYARPRAR